MRTTTTSVAGIWAIVIVAVVCLAFWLVMVVGIAPRPDVRQRHRRQPVGVPAVGGRSVPVAGGMHVAAGGRSVAPSRDEPALEMPVGTEAAGTETPGPQARDSQAHGAQESQDDSPAVPGQRQQATPPAGSSPLDLGPRMPPQREPAADQSAPSRQPDR